MDRDYGFFGPSLDHVRCEPRETWRLTGGHRSDRRLELFQSDFFAEDFFQFVCDILGDLSAAHFPEEVLIVGRDVRVGVNELIPGWGRWWNRWSVRG